MLCWIVTVWMAIALIATNKKKVGIDKMIKVIDDGNFEIYCENIDADNFCKDLFTLLNNRRPELMNSLEIIECGKVKIYIMSNSESFINYIATNFGVRLPSYCHGTIQERRYIFSNRKYSERGISIYDTAKKYCS